jgi:putative flippase GtrA
MLSRLEPGNGSFVEIMKTPGILSKAISAKDRKSGPRYLAIVLGGFVVDLSIAWSTHTFLGVHLVAAAAIGFVIAMTISYFAHEFWTFERPGSAVSGRRFAKFVAAAGATLGTRLALVWLSGLVNVPGGAIIQLGFAYGGSLVVGFLVNRSVVFTDEPTPDIDPG